MASTLATRWRDARVLRDVAAAALDTTRPLLAQIVVTRRCNLACGYCFEHDHVSKPVPTADLLGRFDHLKRLRVVFVTLNGGEPLMHPDVVDLVAAIRDRGMTPMMNTNGLLLKEPLVHALNDAGLFGMQVSCDALTPNDVTEKALSRLRPKLDLLAAHASFRVRVNTVLGAAPPAAAVEVVREAARLGFDAQCSLRRDATGAVVPFDAETRAAYAEIRAMRGRLPAFLDDAFQVPLAHGEPVSWKCRSGARYFHVDADGLVHLCQPREGVPAKPLAAYGTADIERYFHMHKPCSVRCPHAYAHLGSRLDAGRPQEGPWSTSAS